jgi:hypothetical protein
VYRVKRVDENRCPGERQTERQSPAAKAFDEVGFGRPVETGFGDPTRNFSDVGLFHARIVPRSRQSRQPLAIDGASFAGNLIGAPALRGGTPFELRPQTNTFAQFARSPFCSRRFLRLIAA